jgi:hypothetical protein
MGEKSEAAAQLGKLGGSKTSDRKSRSSRENGKKGGRPRRNPRLEAFNGFADNPGMKNLFKKLSDADLEECRTFIRERAGLDRNEFAAAVNRWKLDQPKPKNFTSMWSLVLESNSVEPKPTKGVTP